MLPANEWWGILGGYGAAIWPAQLFFFSGGLVLTILLFRSRRPLINSLMKLYLAVSFGWISVVFFLTLGKGLAGNLFFAALFMVIAILFAVDIFRRRMDFRLPEVGWQKTLTLCLALIVWCYPLLSMALGRPVEKWLVPGVFPCPTTALALVLLAASLPGVNRVLYILLLFWAIPFAPFIQIPRYGVYEDMIMFGVGIYGLVMLVRHWKVRTLAAVSQASAPADKQRARINNAFVESAFGSHSRGACPQRRQSGRGSIEELGRTGFPPSRE